MKDGPSFVLTLKLSATHQQEQELDHRFNVAWQIKNHIISCVQHKLNRLQYSAKYHLLRQDYHKYQETEDSVNLDRVKVELNAMIEAEGLTNNGLDKLVVEQQRKYKKYIDANSAQTIAEEVYNGVSKILYGNGQKLHHKRLNDMVSISGKTNKQGIRFIPSFADEVKVKKGEELTKSQIKKMGRRHEFTSGMFVWGDLRIAVNVPKKDTYAREALKNPIKLCRITRKMLGSRWHYYVQIVFKGIPPQKHKMGEGTVGIDNGPSCFAVVGEKEVKFEPLGVNTDKIDKKIAAVQQAMDRSRRATNPDRYNEDGTVKRGIRGRWNFSNRYKVLQRRLKGLYERRARTKKENAERIANEILAMGDSFITEPLKYSALKKKSKKTTINKRTGRPNSKKRFGRSISRNTPASVEAALERKLGYHGKAIARVDLQTYRASQYNHVTGEYKKKKIKERWTKIGDRWIQRDMYSALLLACPNAELNGIDQNKCTNRYDSFLKIYLPYIEGLRNSDVELPDCCGIHRIKKSA